MRTGIIKNVFQKRKQGTKKLEKLFRNKEISAECNLNNNPSKRQ